MGCLLIIRCLDTPLISTRLIINLLSVKLFVTISTSSKLKISDRVFQATKLWGGPSPLTASSRVTKMVKTTRYLTCPGRVRSTLGSRDIACQISRLVPQNRRCRVLRWPRSLEGRAQLLETPSTNLTTHLINKICNGLNNNIKSWAV